MRWPKLPQLVYGPGGSIRVMEVPQPKAEGEDDPDGTWEPGQRVIEIKDSLTPREKWVVYFHEVMHATLADSGLVNLLTDESGEALCDAVATARIVEMAGQQQQ